MQRIRIGASLLCALGLLAGLPAWADKPEWAGEQGRHQQRERDAGYAEPGQHSEAAREEREGYERFSDQQRSAIRQYYARQLRSGHCPPGLAKKRNGCLPPGQARKWKLGEPLPQDLAYYDLPPSVLTQLGPPPAGHRYVRVASDILLIAAGTGMVVDAIQDLGRQ
jgi:hypothetical protein